MKRLILIIVGLIFFIGTFFIYKIDFSVLFSMQNPIFIIVGMFLFLFSITVGSLRTKFLLKSWEKKKYHSTDLILIEFISKFIYYLLPGRLNIPAKAILINNKFNIGKGPALAVTSLEYALDIGCMLIFGFIGFSLFFQSMYAKISVLNIVVTIVFLFVCLLIFFVLPKPIFGKLQTFSSSVKNKLLSKVLIFVIKILFNIREVWPKLMSNKRAALTIIFILASWVIVALSTEMIFLASNIYVPILWVITVTAVSIFIGGISQIPGGVGAREITLVFLFVSLGVSQDAAGIVALISRLFTLIPMIIGYVLFVDFESKVGVKIF